MARRDRRPARARWALFAGLLLFLGVQLAFLAVQECFRPYYTDPDYRHRQHLLRQRLDEEPDRPLCLLLGSSRTALSFCPEWLPPRETSPPPLVFNGSHYGSGPILNLTLLRRHLRDGLRPRWLVVELVPGYLCRERESFIVPHLDTRELTEAARYLDLGNLAGWYARTRLEATPRFPVAHLQPPGHKLGPLGGCLVWLPHVTDADRRARTAVARRHFDALLKTFDVAPAEDRAVRDLLAVCREEGIAVVLVLTPEGTEFRNWYGPDTEARLSDYLARLRRDTGVRVVDGRGWLNDDVFYDSHHVMRYGAQVFTHRLDAEVIRPLLAGQLGAIPGR